MKDRVSTFTKTRSIAKTLAAYLSPIIDKYPKTFDDENRKIEYYVGKFVKDLNDKKLPHIPFIDAELAKAKLADREMLDKLEYLIEEINCSIHNLRDAFWDRIDPEDTENSEKEKRLHKADIDIGLLEYLKIVEKAVQDNTKSEDIEIKETNVVEYSMPFYTRWTESLLNKIGVDHEIGKEHYIAKTYDFPVPTTVNIRNLIDLSQGIMNSLIEKDQLKQRHFNKLTSLDITEEKAKLLGKIAKEIILIYTDDLREKVKNAPQEVRDKVETANKKIQRLERFARENEERWAKEQEEELKKEEGKKIYEPTNLIEDYGSFSKRFKKEDKKKTNYPNRSNHADKLEKVRNFIYNNATKTMMVATGTALVASALYSGGLTLLPLAGFAFETTIAMIFLEGSLGAALGAAFGRAASYISGLSINDNNSKPNEKSPTSSLTKNSQTYTDKSETHHRDGLSKQTPAAKIGRR